MYKISLERSVNQKEKEAIKDSWGLINRTLANLKHPPLANELK